jgi:hypothetical protein
MSEHICMYTHLYINLCESESGRQRMHVYMQMCMYILTLENVSQGACPTVWNSDTHVCLICMPYMYAAGTCPIVLDSDTGQCLLEYNGVSNDFKFDRVFGQARILLTDCLETV